MVLSIRSSASLIPVPYSTSASTPSSWALSASSASSATSCPSPFFCETRVVPPRPSCSEPSPLRTPWSSSQPCPSTYSQPSTPTAGPCPATTACTSRSYRYSGRCISYRTRRPCLSPYSCPCTGTVPSAVRSVRPRCIRTARPSIASPASCSFR